MFEHFIVTYLYVCVCVCVCVCGIIPLPVHHPPLLRTSLHMADHDEHQQTDYP